MMVSENPPPLGEVAVRRTDGEGAGARGVASTSTPSDLRFAPATSPRRGELQEC